MSTAVHWPVDDIDDALAADFDGSLSGLGMELGTSSFNMSEALMALPSLKSENHNHHNHHHHNHTNGISRNHNEGNGHHSPAHSQHSNSSQKGNNSDSNSSTLTLTLSNHSNQDDRPVAVVHGKKNRLACGHDDESVSSAIKRFCVSNDRDANSESIRFLLAPQSYHKDSDNNECNHEDCAAEIRCQHRHSNSVPDLRSASSAINNQVYSGSASPPLYSSSNPPSTVAGLPQILSVHHHHVFSPSISSSPLMQEQRSPLTKTSNEFQYVLGAATAVSTKLHEETMTYLNQGQPYEIKLKKLGDLSEMRGKMLKSLIRVGFHERRLQFMEKDLINQWKQQRQTERILDIDIPLSYGIFDIAHDSQDINRCEFMWDPTKETGVFVKHGGEKGVPFRLIIETHNMNNNGNSKTCVHAASCQVKVFKPKGADRKHKTDREKMSKRPQSEQDKFQPSCDCTVFTEYPIESIYWSSPSYAETQCPSPSSTVNSPSMSKVLESTPHLKALPAPSTSKNIESPVHQSSTSTLSSEATASETSAWLRQNRFEDYIRSFSNFSGADLLRLNRHDLTQICGLTDGIRLYNALNLKAIRPRLTLYICHPSEEHFNAIYLENLTVDELKQKLASVVSRTLKINRICLSGPSDIKVLITDEVIRNMNEESMFYVEFDKDSSGENMYNAILSAYK
ncbi:Transcription factor CP2-like protein [Dinothrombium tinctorium]|uniref:Transcription factor CP2-like protein n=1 Tax=Dinothrombium tinctorium TaxID=1965070 RepID=A0A443RAN6_9ACAR|nr:Transcription factor CP2-like protein [Dinothrombium tinctorium]